jgi:hypothetical protein
VDRPGRACPLGYRYRPEALAQPARLEADTLYVADDVVDRSNQIITRLRATATRFPGLVRRLGELPLHLTASVGGQRVGIVHGDPESLAGWRLALEAMEPGDPEVRRQAGWRGQATTAAELLEWFHRADVGGGRCDALPVRFDLSWWTRRFLAWPPGSPRHRSYLTRLTGGTHLHPHQAARDGVQLASRDGTGP